MDRAPELRAIARIRSSALVANARRLAELLPGQSLIAMVKADAYGHGAGWAGRLLLKERSVSSFGVATISEGIELRRELGARGARVPILVFSGATPWPRGSRGDELGKACHFHGLTPVIASIEDWRSFHSGFPRKSWSVRIPFELKFNTGMNRLGIGLEHLGEIRRDLLRLSQIGVFPGGIFSHLAVGEDATHPVSRLQAARFEALCSELSAILPDSVDFHLANSAAVLGAKKWKFLARARRARPGLALYGIAPEGARRDHGLTPVLTLEAPVILLHELAPGESVGYGGRYITRKKERVAVLGLGYAEGVHRSFGQPGSGARALLRGRLEPFVGPFSMDLCSVRASRAVRRGDWARLWGEGIDPYRQAAAANTIPYEFLTSLTRRVQRIHG